VLSFLLLFPASIPLLRWKTSILTSFFKQDAEAAAEIKKKRSFRKFSYRGIDLDQYEAHIYTYIQS
jgi:hypothetical protein